MEAATCLRRRIILQPNDMTAKPESQLVKAVRIGYNRLCFSKSEQPEDRRKKERKMSDNEMNSMEEDIIVFEDEEGNEYSYVVVDYMFYNGEEYALLTEADAEADDENNQECIICKVVADEEDGEETESFELVEDEDTAQKLVDIFNTKMQEEEEE